MHTTTRHLPIVPFPAGASFVDGWDTTGHSPARYWETPRMLTPCPHGDVSVWVAGFQYADGRCVRGDGSMAREIVVNELHADFPITPQQARQIARALVQAADMVDRMNEGEA